MGELRNKQHKEAEWARIREMQAKLDAAHPKPKLPRCQCGKSYYEVPAMWVVHIGHAGPVKFYCPDCLPICIAP
jgi:hypothetical protein